MVSVLLATTGRAEMAETCVRSLRATATVEIVGAVDRDATTRNRLAPLVDVVLYSEEYRGAARAWNDALVASSGDPVVLAADDLVFQPGWLDAALYELAQFEDGWGFVGLNADEHGPGLATHYIVSRRLIREAFGGVIAWECYSHNCSDCEANERARSAGRYAWCAQAHVAHSHWTAGTRPKDATDHKNLVDRDASEETYARRAAAGFPNDYAPVI